MNKDLMGPDKWSDKWSYKTSKTGIISKISQKVSNNKMLFGELLGMLLDSAGKSQMKVIELGCAPGKILSLLHQVRPQHDYFGIDYSGEGIYITRRNLHELGIKATVWEGDVNTFQPPEFFDMVISCGLIEHFDDPVSILRRHLTFAVKGGIVAVTIPNFSNPVVQFFCRRFSPEKLKTHNLKIMNPVTLENTMKECGLENIKVGLWERPRLPNPTSSGLSAEVYRYFCRSFNLISSAFSDDSVLWNSMFWGCGRMNK